MFKDSPIIGNIKLVTIKRELGAYFACITTDATKSISCQDENQILGIDMGIVKFATLSDGSFISNQRHFRQYERRLRIENRALSRKRKGGKNWVKQAKRLSRLHNKIGNVRKDFLHKQSTTIARAASTVFLEDLKVSRMSRNKNLSRHILDCGWGMFRSMLEYKTNVIAVNPKFTSQTCSACGHQDAESRLSQADFKCSNCGMEMNADSNAALIILSKGIANVRQRSALAQA